MENKFEYDFSNKQIELLSLTAEYVKHQADEIYCYITCENNWSYFNAAFKMNKSILYIHEVGDYFGYSDDFQINFLNIAIQDVTKLVSICDSYAKPIPTEIKMTYTKCTDKLHADYKYDNQYIDDDELLPSDFFEIWITELKQQA